VSWYESLSDSERASAPEPKLLLSIAARLPENASELSRMKGIGRRFVEQHGDSLTGRILNATAEADAADFVAIEPAPYATFRDIRLDAWLGELRAEICAELMVAPELALPARIVRKLREALARGSFEAALGALAGWRTQLLGDAFRAYVAAKPPPV
jgi:ribonuclease D